MYSTNALTSTFLQTLVNSSTQALLVFQANSPVEGLVSELRLSMLNSAAEQDLERPSHALLDHTFDQIFPHLQGTELGNRYQRAVETGLSDQVVVHASRFNPAQVVGIRYPVSLVWLGSFLVISYEQSLLGKPVWPVRQSADEVPPGTPLFDEIIDTVPAGIALLQAIRNGPDRTNRISDFRITQINSRLEGILVQSVTPLTDGLLTTVFPQATASGMLSRFISVVEQKEYQQFEMPLNRLNQSGWFQISMTPQEDQLMLAVTDITDTKRAQLAHHHQAGLLSSVLEASQNAILAFESIRDSQQQIVDFRYVPLHAVHWPRPGLRQEPTAGCTLIDLFPYVVNMGLLSQLMAVVVTGQPLRRDVEFDDGQGVGWFNWSVVKRRDGIVLTIMDKTSERLADERLRSHQRQLEETNGLLRRSNENLQQFAYVASHDLQEPLRKVQQFGDLLRTQYADQLGEGVDYLDRMQAAARRMSTLIRDLLAFARISTGLDAMVTVSLEQVVREVLSDVELSIQEAGAVVSVEFLPTVVGDSSQLKQLFQNLLSNALKFRRLGVSPIIDVRAKTVSAIDLPAWEAPSRLVPTYYCISVSDNGIGFDEKYVDRIFQVFQRLHGKSQYAGTGIGLAICEKVVTNHGGAIVATSQPGRGATFSVYLPA